MRRYSLLILIIVLSGSCGFNNRTRLTVVLFENGNQYSKIDTLLKMKEIDFLETPIDIFYSSKQFQLPYYVPTGGIFKNVGQSKECDETIFPADVKCYKYDSLNRVVEMSIYGSGILKNFLYTYNSKGQIIYITDMGVNYKLSYDAANNLSQLIETYGRETKKLVFTYN